MSSESENARKRVCKACDRCRLKKSKCDGSSPCSRCKADNAICVFGERKKSHDKVYPKGYVEMLEQQQSQLVTGLQVLYKRLQAGEGWPGLPLESHGGQPLTHDILERLDLLHSTDASIKYEDFDEDLSHLKRRLEGSSSQRRRRSPSAESDHSEPSLTSSRSSRGVSSPHSLSSLADTFSQGNSPATQFLNNPYLSSPVKPQQYTIPSMVPGSAMATAINPMDLEQAWIPQQNLFDPIDMSYNPTSMSFDPNYGYPSQEPEVLAWNDYDMQDFLHT
ncbi:hypothetical protein EJ08DRAFT_698216 [Tothia fuscella]|uniref:Zn(2)-C6 fungal-type domain-containing protein n=1 Tax=Tothia fuscella TaxID=1048955 RepID=A0A9P4NPX7_9PEZI|nr:hypothetical protein EJ08DRAFT_698216 [Tothia fuscella]